MSTDSPDTILIVDDEEPVRRTFREWLDEARLGAEILTAADAEAALVLANERAIDLAILDWNLGAGNDGLQLLEDLYLFNADIVAIMVTGYAAQATPLDAMRMGVRDYLDKNQDLDRDTFLRAVRRQLERIRPAKRERQLHARLVAFREAVEKVLPLARSAAALNDPLSPPEAIAGLFRFLLRSTGAADGVLVVRSYDADRTPAELCRVYSASGEQRAAPAVPFSRSVAGAVFGQGGAKVLNRPAEAAGIEWQDFERGRQSLLVAPLPAGAGLQVVLELFDRPDGFTEQDRQLVGDAAAFGGEVLRQALSERQTTRALLDAVAAALGAGNSLRESLKGSEGQRLQEPPPADVMERLQQGLGSASGAVSPEDALRLAEAVRVVALRHGSEAVRHCIEMVESLRKLLDSVSGVEAVS
jgi:two-component system, NtrC family, nitrogen regulation response regulator NtrX